MVTKYLKNGLLTQSEKPKEHKCKFLTFWENLFVNLKEGDYWSCKKCRVNHQYTKNGYGNYYWRKLD